MLELKNNKNHQTKFFDDFNHANYYSIIYEGKVNPVTKSGFKEVQKYDYTENKMVTAYYNDDKTEMYMVNVSKTKRIKNGFKPIKDIIYCLQKMNLYNNYKKLTELNIRVYGIKTDCLFVDGNEDKILKKLIYPIK